MDTQNSAKLIHRAATTRNNGGYQCVCRVNTMSTSGQQAEQQADKMPASSKQDYYTCGKCATRLFCKLLVLHEGVQTATHVPAHAGTVSGVKASWGHQYTAANAQGCSSVFLTEAPDWASGAVSANEGRFVCPKCHNRVGSFAWSGAPCSCGRWITPAFQFQLSRVDARRNLPLPALVAACSAQTTISPPTTQQ